MHLQRRRRFLRRILQPAVAFASALPGRAATVGFLVVIALCAALAAPSDAATDGQVRILAQGWWSDAGGKATLADAEAAHYTPFTGVLSKGFGTDALWIRLTLAAAPAAGPEVLRIRQSYLDEIALYDPLERRGGSVVPRYTGDRRPLTAADYAGLRLGFVLPASDAARDVYLRVQTTSARVFYAELLPEDVAARAEQREELLDGLYLGLLLVFIVWAAVNYALDRERLIAFFAFKQGMAIAQALVFFGFVRLLFAGQLDPEVQHVVANLVVFLIVPISIGFEMLLLREFDPPPRPWRALVALLAAWPVTLLLWATGYLSLGLFINQGYVLVAPVLLFLIAWNARAWDRDPGASRELLARWMLRGYYSLLLGTTLLIALPTLGILATPEWTLDASVLHGFVSGLIVISLLIVRARHRERRLQESLVQVRVAEQAAAAEKDRREENERFLAMLAHELKNPLGAIRMLLANPAPRRADLDDIKRLVSDIDGVIELCVQSGQLEHGRFVRQTADCDIGDVVEEVRRHLASGDRIRLDVVGPASVRTDFRLLAIILENLLGNAGKYSPADSAVDVAVRPAIRERQDGVEVVVANLPGRVGFPDALRVFQKYYRSPRSRGITGSGLGLYLVAELARFLGGAVEYVPDGERVRFLLWLPR